MTAELVSVVIPSYNRAYCIAETLDSVLNQTYPTLEVIVVDDGSTDGTEALLAERYRSEPRLRYVRQANGGVSAARNHGLRLVRGDYVALLDSDDSWHPWKIEAQVACLRAIPSAGMVWTDMQAVDPDGVVTHERYLTTMYRAYVRFPREKLFRESRRLSTIAPDLAARLGDPLVYSGDIFSPMITGNLVHTSTVLLRRERCDRVGGFSLELRGSGEDYDYHLRTCREGEVAYLDAPSIRYQVGRADQLTIRPELHVAIAENGLRTLENALARDRQRVDLPPGVLDEVLAGKHAWVGEARLDAGDRRGARRHLAMSLRIRPNQPRVWALLQSSFLPPAAARELRSLYSAVKRRLRPGGG